MADITFSSSARMLTAQSWNARAVLQGRNASSPNTGEFWLIDDANPIASTVTNANQLRDVLDAGSPFIRVWANQYPSSTGDIIGTIWYEPTQDILPDASGFPDSFYIANMSMPFDSFMAYFETGDQAGFFTDALSGNDFFRGSAYYDQIVGYAGDDYIDGRRGNDTLIGHLGSDTLRGAEGNDTLIGDIAGDRFLDYALYASPCAEYTIAPTGSNWMVADLVVLNTLNEGIDVLNGVERLIFTDTNVALDIDGNPAMAYRTYKAAFDRAPDLPGLGFWINSLDLGTTGLQMAQGFVNSAEFGRMYGFNPSAADYVDRLYLNVLDRPGETEGRNFWVNALNRGASRAEVLFEFAQSPENVANVAPLIANGIEYTPFA